jgi:Ca2+-binding RTX toxin-like protein
MAGRIRTLAFAAAGAGAAALGATSLAGAQAQTEPSWSCRASVAYLELQGLNRIEPLVANPNGPLCDDDGAGFDDIVLGGRQGDPGKIVVSAPSAITRLEPDAPGGPAQVAGAETLVGHVEVSNADRSFVLTADVVRSTASGHCVNGSPVIDSASKVANVSVNGQAVLDPDGLLEQVGNGISDSGLGQLVQVRFNENVTEGDASSATQSVTRRAIHVQLFPSQSGGQPVLNAVVGESTVGRTGNVCADRGDGGDGGGGGGGGNPTVVSDFPTPRSSPCRNRRFGRNGRAILGTRRADRFTGTNRSDRIFVFGGNDRVSGGRGNDCVEGGSGSDRIDGSTGYDYLIGDRGNDQLSGGTNRDVLSGGPGQDKLVGGSGSDRMIGGSGRDKLSGGLGNDRLSGGSGNDLIHTGNGRDVVNAGSGNDAVNAATAGPPARINCGAGFDIVRVNQNELRRTRNCERILVIRLAR